MRTAIRESDGYVLGCGQHARADKIERTAGEGRSLRARHSIDGTQQRIAGGMGVEVELDKGRGCICGKANARARRNSVDRIEVADNGLDELCAS
jgi:hypothetical protein